MRAYSFCLVVAAGSRRALAFSASKSRQPRSSVQLGVASIATASGDADRAFRSGVELEKAGLTRTANAAFHEAATLYQCFVDNISTEGSEEGGETSNIFQHVTSLSPEECLAVLAYSCIRLAHLSHDAFGDSRAAKRLYRLACKIDPKPSAVAFHGVGTSVESSITQYNDEGRNWRDGMEVAVKAYRDSIELGQGLGNSEVRFHLAVALERLGELEESEKIMDSLRRGEANLSCLVDSWGYVRWHTRRTPASRLNLHGGTRSMIQIALDAAKPLIHHDDGLVCEFGVASGRSIRMTEELLPLTTQIEGFDTFTGLPVAWGSEPAGSYSTGGALPKTEHNNVHFHKGLFKDTIPRFLSTVDKGRPLAYANIDCDLYGSTVDVLEAFHGRIICGTVIVFDEYLCHSSWRQDEFRAWRECCKRFGWNYEYLAFSLSTKQAVVRVTS